MLELGLPRRFNAAVHFIDRHVAEGRGGRTAILSEGRSWSYAQVQAQVNRTANLLAGLGVGMEQRVALILKDSPQTVFAFYGAIKLGAVPIPTNILMKGPDFLYVLNDSRAPVLVVDAAFLPEIEKIRDQAIFLKHVLVCGGEGSGHADFDALAGQAASEFTAAETTCDDAAFWLYSGRNPERLMAAVHHHSHLVYCAEAYAKGVLDMNSEDRVLASFLFFAYGLGNGLVFPFHVGAATILLSHPPKPELVYQDLLQYRPTLFFTVPTLLGGLADYRRACREAGREPAPVEGLRACISSAEILSPEVYRRFTGEFGVEVLEGTGSTEIGHIFLSNRPGAVRPGSTGRVVDGYRTRLLDEDGRPVGPGRIGNLLVAGGSIASAYWNQRDETRRNMQGEWFVTGDRYLVDEDGFYYFRGRSDDMLRVGGKWLAPQEVESTIDLHPAVAQSAVVGFKDADALVTPCAFVVPAPGAVPSEKLAEEIRQFVKARIAPYKYPRRITFCDALPRTPGGRLQRFLLQERLDREKNHAQNQ